MIYSIIRKTQRRTQEQQGCVERKRKSLSTSQHPFDLTLAILGHECNGGQDDAGAGHQRAAHPGGKHGSRGRSQGAGGIQGRYTRLKYWIVLK